MTKKTTTKRAKRILKKFSLNVCIWNFNQDKLETYDVVPHLKIQLRSCKKNEKPKTRDELSEFLRREAQYMFWAKCEWEMIIHSWPFRNEGREEKVDVYSQLKLNWDAFVDAFWASLQK